MCWKLTVENYASLKIMVSGYHFVTILNRKNVSVNLVPLEMP